MGPYIAVAVAGVILALAPTTTAFGVDEAPLWFTKTECANRPTLWPVLDEKAEPYPLQPAGHSKYIGLYALQEHPLNWTLPAGSRVVVVGFLSGFEKLVLAPHPLRDPAAMMNVRLATILRDEVLIEYSLQAEADDEGVFGYQETVITTFDSGIQRFEFEVQTTRPVALPYDASFPYLGIEFRLSGATSTEERPVLVHMGPHDVASHVWVEGLPYESYKDLATYRGTVGNCGYPGVLSPGERPAQRVDAPGLNFVAVIVMAASLGAVRARCRWSPRPGPDTDSA